MLPPVSLKNAAASLTNVPSACGAPVAIVATDWPKQLGGSDGPADACAVIPRPSASVTTPIVDALRIISTTFLSIAEPCGEHGRSG